MENKKRLIYAKFAQLIANAELSRDDAGTVQWVLSHTPTVDAVEVVRCKDCNFWRRCGETNKGECDGMEVYGLMDADDYCSFGERKDNA